MEAKRAKELFEKCNEMVELLNGMALKEGLTVLSLVVNAVISMSPDEGERQFYRAGFIKSLSEEFAKSMEKDMKK